MFTPQSAISGYQPLACHYVHAQPPPPSWPPSNSRKSRLDIGCLVFALLVATLKLREKLSGLWVLGSVTLPTFPSQGVTSVLLSLSSIHQPCPRPLMRIRNLCTPDQSPADRAGTRISRRKTRFAPFLPAVI